MDQERSIVFIANPDRRNIQALSGLARLLGLNVCFANEGSKFEAAILCITDAKTPAGTWMTLSNNRGARLLIVRFSGGVIPMMFTNFDTVDFADDSGDALIDFLQAVEDYC